MFETIKTYTPEQGLSCCFRQWRANHSHCQFLHSYAIGVELTFESETLDEKNWAVDFGSLKPIKEWLVDTFDHKTCVAHDDPQLEKFKELNELGIIQLNIVDHVGCEMFAKMIYEKVEWFIGEFKQGRLTRYPFNPDARIKSVRVYEHGANAATYSKF